MTEDNNNNNKTRNKMKRQGDTQATFHPTEMRLLASRNTYDGQKDQLLQQLNQGNAASGEDRRQAYANTQSFRGSTRLQQLVERSERDNVKEHKQRLSQRQNFYTWIQFRIWCGTLINNDAVQIGMIGIIFLNALVMGIATFDFVTDNPEISQWFGTIDFVFLLIYTVELVLQFIYFGWRMLYDSWLAFDFLVVTVSWAFDIWTIVSDVEANGEGASAGQVVQIIRAFRVFRALRLVTRLKVLRDLVAAIGEVLPRLSAIATLLLLFNYIFSVLFTDLFRTVEVEGDYPFQTLHDSLLTSVELMTLEWGDFARTCMEEYPSYGWIPFVAFIFLTGFVVLNLIIAVVCDAVAIIDMVAKEREKITKSTESLDVTDDDIMMTDSEQLAFAQERIVVLQERLEQVTKSQQQMLTILQQLANQVSDDDDMPKFSSDNTIEYSPLGLKTGKSKDEEFSC